MKKTIKRKKKIVKGSGDSGIVHASKIEMVDISSIKPLDNKINAKDEKTFKAAIPKLAVLLKTHGIRTPLTVWRKDMTIYKGNLTYNAAKAAGFKKVPVTFQDFTSSAAAVAYAISDNVSGNFTGYDDKVLGVLMKSKTFAEIGGITKETASSITGFSKLDFDKILHSDDAVQHGALAKEFTCPPFSVIDTAKGAWKYRKDVWVGLGISSEDGRLEGVDTNVATPWASRGKVNTGGSIFNPALAETLCKWFCRPGGRILDPFAGGSVRGVVAGWLGYTYTGIDLSKKQVLANREQADTIFNKCTDRQIIPKWMVGDSANLTELYKGTADFIFSCPPYADLEKYSTDKRDLSNMDYKIFMSVYSSIISSTYKKLKGDSFACFVVGEVRKKDGTYYNFVGDTITAFLSAGYSYYNEIIYVTPAGSLPVRVGKMFRTSRKIGKTHQSILVFVKGDAKKATAKINQTKEN